MTVKSDRWISRMAEEHKLIQPFNATLVREVEGRRIISAGASSYGYDMRLADDGFRVFSPIHGREIDPKRFDEESLVEPPLRAADDGSKYYLMPPHSYALGVTVETFSMPRNVTGICMGKCLTRDARIVDADTGDLISIADFTSGGRALAYGDDGRISGHAALAVVNQGRKPVFTVKTRLGHKIKATANHPFLTASGWKPLEDLSAGNRIAAARRLPIFGREALPDWEAALLGFMIAEGQCDTPGSSPVFTTADGALAGALTECVRAGFGGAVTFNGRYGYRLVNRVGRGGLPESNRAARWLKAYNLNTGALRKFVPARIFRAPKRSVALFLRALFSGDGSVFLRSRGERVHVGLEYCSSSERLARDVHHLLLRFGIVSCLREKATAKANTYVVQVFRAADVKLFLDEIGFWPGSLKDAKVREVIRPALDALVSNHRRLHDTIPSEFWTVLRAEAQDLQTTLYASGIHVRSDHDVTYSDLQKFIAQNPQSKLGAYLDADVIWDEIVSIESDGVEEVFDICVPRVSNFVANNLVVHNSTYARAGLIVNTTPLEAGWTGRLVIELGNLAALPLRVYVNEGIGQVLFFESDEDCSTSYEDRGGKYQGQTGLTYSRL
jgi:deoxycytidine triphosphate deaminase/intein/homing endonuclease